MTLVRTTYIMAKEDSKKDDDNMTPEQRVAYLRERVSIGFFILKCWMLVGLINSIDALEMKRRKPRFIFLQILLFHLQMVS